jgi:hypothetical protein
MEIAGLALGVPGVISLLHNTAFDGYRIFADARDLDNDLEEYQRQFKVQRESLRDWAAAPNSPTEEGISQPGTTTSATKFFDRHPEKLELVAITLARITKLFADVEQLENSYGIKITRSESVVTKGSSDTKQVPLRQTFKQKTRGLFRKMKPIDGSVQSPLEIFPDLNLPLPLETVRVLAEVQIYCFLLREALMGIERQREYRDWSISWNGTISI